MRGIGNEANVVRNFDQDGSVTGSSAFAGSVRTDLLIPVCSGTLPSVERFQLRISH